MRLASLLPVLALAGAVADPFAFFRPSVAIDAEDEQRLDRGEPLVRILPARDREVAVCAAVAVHADGDRLAAWVRDISALKKSAMVPSIGRLSDPPRIEDLAGLSLGQPDLSALRSCRPDDCDLLLSRSEIDQARQAEAHAGAHLAVALQDAFRRIVLERARAYVARGFSEIPESGEQDRASPEARFSAMVRRWRFLTDRMPEFASHLERYPRVRMPGVESFLYWSKERLGGREVVRLTHVAIVRGSGQPAPAALVAGIQIFATRYVTESLGLTALLQGGPGSPNYLVYLNRSNVDVLGGFFGGLVRLVVEHRLKPEAADVLEGLRGRLESGPPR
jgi:hypothetical protein